MNTKDIIDKYNKGMSVLNIAKLYKCRFYKIKEILTDNDISIIAKNIKNLPMTEVIIKYHSGMSSIGLAKEYDCSDTTIRYHLKKAGVKYNSGIPDNIPKGHKFCHKCKTIKELNKFYTSNFTRSGYATYCKTCEKKKKDDKKDYYIEYRQRTKKHRADAKRKRYHSDSSFKILDNIRSRINDALINSYKSIHTMELIDCTIDEFKTHLQQTAIKNGYTEFDINSYSGQDYHIDHIKPCSSFNLTNPEEQKQCFHYTNTQILSAEENMIKHDRHDH